jgi:hypothetical protein
MAAQEQNDTVCSSPACPSKEDNKNLGQCMICQSYYHYQCAKVGNKTKFVCSSCKETVVTMKSLQSTILSLNNLLSTNVETITSLQHDLNHRQEQYRLLHDECVKLKEENRRLQELAKNTQNDPVLSMQTDNVSGSLDSSDHLVIVDSVLRDIDEEKLVQTNVQKLPGGRIANVQKKLESYHGASYKSVTLHVATNDLYDLRDEPEKIQDAVDNYKSLIQQAKPIADQVHISSVCPRLDCVKELVQPFNAALKVLCEETGVNFIDHTPSFTLGDGDINDGYLWKHGPHLTRPGVNCVVRKLRMLVKPGITDVSKDRYSLNQTRSSRPRTDSSDVIINKDGCRITADTVMSEDTIRTLVATLGL